MLRKGLLVCGVLASLVYVGVDWLAAIRYPEYHSFSSRMISELMANGAPTESLVDPFFLLYDVLMMAFAVGVWRSSPRRRVQVTAGLLFAYGALGLTGPVWFEMNVRGSPPSSAETLHIALTAALVLLIMATLAVAAPIHGRRFRLYSYATLVALVVFGILTSFAGRGMAAGEPTPGFGALERLDIGAFLLWVAVLAVSFLRAPARREATATLTPRAAHP